MTIEVYGSGSDETAPHWFFFIATCLAIYAAGVKAGRVAAVFAGASFFGLLLAEGQNVWQAIHEPKLWHLTVVLVCILLVARPPRGMSGAYARRIQSMSRRIAAKAPVSRSSVIRRRNMASINATISVSSPRGLPERLRSVSTS